MHEDEGCMMKHTCVPSNETLDVKITPLKPSSFF